MRKENEEFTLKELFMLFWPKFWIILICGIICAGAVGAYSAFLQEDKYTASARIYVYMERANESASNSYYDSMTSQKMVKTYGIVIKSGKFLNKVVDAIEDAEEYDLTVEKIASALQIKQIDETEVFEVFYTSSDRELTNKILSEITIVAETELKTIVKSEAAKVNIIDETEAKNPDSKHVARNALIAFLAGVVACMVVIFVLNQFDVVIHNKKKIEDNFDLPVLGVIPRQNVASKKSGGANNVG